MVLALPGKWSGTGVSALGAVESHIGAFGGDYSIAVYPAEVTGLVAVTR